VAEGLSIFDAASTKQIVPDPRLRAALVALLGTAGEPALSAITGGIYGEVFFATPPAGDHVIAQVIKQPSRDRADIVFNVKYQYEDFRLLASTAAHEPLHQDPSASGNEELVANSIDTLVYGQILLETPSLTSSGTPLARVLNTELMGRLNTRDADGDLRLFVSRGNIYPGGVPVDNYATLFPPDGVATPGNTVLRGEVRNVVGPNVTLPADLDFGDETLILLDRHQALFTDAEVVRLAQVLRLDVYPPSITNNSPTGTIASRTPTMAARVSDKETNLAAANIRLFVDGSRKSGFAYDRTRDRLTYKSASLTRTRHTVKIVATDAQGKSAAKSWKFTVE
jgi:hypothetical protein